MKRRLPVYSIGSFKGGSGEGEFYANSLAAHIRLHDFTKHPHKHDFYLVMLFTKGTGRHIIDFKSYAVRPGTLFFMRPGQMHSWDLSPDCDGSIFFHDDIFFDQSLNDQHLQAQSLSSVFNASPCHHLSSRSSALFEPLFSEITQEFRSDKALKFQKLNSLVTLTYIELLRVLPQQVPVQHEHYLLKLKEFREQLELHFKEEHSASFYAELMNMSDKHLNRICRTCLDKTSTEIIAERIVQEARRLLIGSGRTVAEIAYELGFKDRSYFGRFFKKHGHQSPLEFLKEQRHL